MTQKGGDMGQTETKKARASVCKISGKMKLATTVFVVAF